MCWKTSSDETQIGTTNNLSKTNCHKTQIVTKHHKTGKKRNLEKTEMWTKQKFWQNTICDQKYDSMKDKLVWQYKLGCNFNLHKHNFFQKHEMWQNTNLWQIPNCEEEEKINGQTNFTFKKKCCRTNNVVIH